LFLVFLVLGVTSSLYGQWRIGVGMDVFKTDFQDIAAKNQIGLEANYFLVRNFALTAGFEMWSAGANSLVLGGRFYPVNPVFVRFRGLLKNQSDVSLGLGYVQSLTRNWKLDYTGDYYFNEGEFGIRIGIAYLL
jgi:hypothetical protein